MIQGSALREVHAISGDWFLQHGIELTVRWRVFVWYLLVAGRWYALLGFASSRLVQSAHMCDDGWKSMECNALLLLAEAITLRLYKVLKLHSLCNVPRPVAHYSKQGNAPRGLAILHDPTVVRLDLCLDTQHARRWVAVI